MSEDGIGLPIKLNIVKNGNRLSALFFLTGVLYFLGLLHPSARQDTKVQESALLAGLVDEEISSMVTYFQLKRSLSDANFNSTNVPKSTLDWALAQFGASSLETGVQRYAAVESLGSNASGRTVYGLFRAKGSTECIIVSAPASSPASVAFLVFISRSVLDRNYWAKNMMFIVSEHSALGMMAWMSAYYYGKHPYIRTSRVPLHAGRIEVAIGIHFARRTGQSFSHVDIDFNQVNGQLPNLDLVNTAIRAVRKHDLIPSIFGQPLKNYASEMDEAKDRILTTVRGLLAQSVGFANEMHTVCGQFRVHSLTLRPYAKLKRPKGSGELSMARIVEGMLRSVNNLQEVLHQSTFFYFMPSAESFVSIGFYAPAIGLLVLVPFIQALRIWVIFWKADREDGLLLKSFTNAIPLFTFPLCSLLVLILLPSINSFEYIFGVIIVAHLAPMAPILANLGEADVENVYMAFRTLIMLLLTLSLSCMNILNYGLGLAYCLTFMPVLVLLRRSGSTLRFIIQLFPLLAVHPFILSCLLRSLQTVWNQPFLPTMGNAAWNCSVKGAAAKLDGCVAESLVNYFLYSDWSYNLTVVNFALWLAALHYILPPAFADLRRRCIL